MIRLGSGGRRVYRTSQIRGAVDKQFLKKIVEPSQ